MGHSAWSPTVIGETMKSLSVALLFVLLASARAVPAPRVGDCAAADDYIDEVLANVAKIVVEQGYDPAELPGDEVHFSQDIGFITIHGSARYDQGHFDGLSTIHRTGETQLCVGDTIDVSVSGLGPLDWILGKLAGAIADTIKGFIIPLIEGPIRDILQNIINGMMPPTAAILMQ